jgi:CRISPR-associated protein Cas5d
LNTPETPTVNRKSVPLVIQVRGDAAAFNRPEFRSERITYPVMTPTAAVGILSAIYWHPEVWWQPTRIEVLAPVQEWSLTRNETSQLVSVKDGLAGKTINTVANRQQRSSLCLRDVHYRIHAQIHAFPEARHKVAAYRDQFRRRVNKGACFQQPFLGVREFPAIITNPDDTPPIELTQDLGLMLHSIRYESTPVYDWFKANLTNGVMDIPLHGVNGQRVGIVGMGELTRVPA